MSPVQYVTKKGIPLDQTVHHAIWKVGDVIENSGHPLKEANEFIAKLGGKPESNLVVARLMAKALVEQVYLSRCADVEQVDVVAAQAKIGKILNNNPYIRTESVVEDKPKTRASKSGNDKKTSARVIFDRMRGQAAGTIAKAVALELNITYANAYYYVTRVFK